MGSSSRPSSFLDSARRRRNQRTGQPRGHARMIRLTATRVVLAPGADPTEFGSTALSGRAQCWALDKWTAISELARRRRVDRPRATDVVALHVVDAVVAQRQDRRLVLHVLGDRLVAQRLRNLHDGLD